MAINRITHVTVFVEDQQKALDWYIDKLGFEVVMDNSDVVQNLRWLTVSPAGNPDTQVVLYKAHSAEEKSRVGTNLMTVLRTDDCEAEAKLLRAKGVEIVDPPSTVPWGISCIIKDLYGNPYDLVGPQ